MDAIALLTEDHRKVDELFEQLERLQQPTERKELVGRLVEELSIHAAIEEQELYPVMRSALGDDGPVEEAEHEHAEVKAMLAALSWMRPEHERFDALVTELVAAVRHHVAEEEQDLLPKLRRFAPAADLKALGERLQQAKAGAPKKPDSEALLDLTRDDLYAVAQKIDLEGRSDMDKGQLAQAIAEG